MDYGRVEVIIMLSKLLDAAVVEAGAELGKNSIYMNTNEFYEESLLARFPLKFDQLTAVKTVAAMLGLVP